VDFFTFAAKGQGISFVSLLFLGFFAAVFFLYRCLKQPAQNLLLLAASYLFYAAWDPRFPPLLMALTVFQYYCGGRIGASEDPAERKFFLRLSLAGGLGVLAYFKYADFFAYRLKLAFHHLGFSANPVFYDIVLPVGLSFYTFQMLSYTLDIYWRRAKPAGRFLDFALFTAFFPQLLAGPIGRAWALLPQITNPRGVTRENLRQGAFLFFWGAFQKTFIADNLARLVVPFFASPGPYNGVTVLLMVYAFAFQLYCDFAGYSNIARGLGKCLGFELGVNFDLPYFSKNPVEFWRRWHISLYSWLRDYVYIPLTFGVEHKNYFVAYRSTLIVMLLGAFWHGLGWNYFLWGLFAAASIVVYTLWSLRISKKSTASKADPLPLSLAKMLLHFHFGVCAGWLIARSESLAQMGRMFEALFFRFRFEPGHLSLAASLLFYVALLLMVEAFQKWKNNFWVLFSWPAAFRWIVYSLMAFSILLFGEHSGRLFIYYQF
jgi:D-alanyl-lipoteichoic acid acyltransferase DltB (MBOAT superfamily)